MPQGLYRTRRWESGRNRPQYRRRGRTRPRILIGMLFLIIGGGLALANLLQNLH